jgi:hypothetical protein
MTTLQKKQISYYIAAVIVIGVLAYIAYKARHDAQPPIADIKNATYQVEGVPVTLIDGDSKTAETRYFGNEVKGDFDGNGTTDAVFLLTQNPGGSGTFYYAALALGTAPGSYVGSNALFLGDRIAPQSSEYHDGMIVINYAERSASEPMTAIPSVGVTRTFKVVDRTLTEIKQ